MKKYFFIFLGFFLTGALVWIVRFYVMTDTPTNTASSGKGINLTGNFQVGSFLISESDIEKEKKMFLKLEDEQLSFEEKDTDPQKFFLIKLVERSLLISWFIKDEPERKKYEDYLKKCFQTETDEDTQLALCQKKFLALKLDEQVSKEIPDAEIRNYYDTHRREFEEQEKTVIRQIVTATEDDARNVKNELTKSNFAELAKKHSVTPESEKGGLLKPFSRGEMPQFFDIVYTMNVGSMSDIIKSPYGFHIIRLEGKLPEKQLTFEEARPVIKQKLHQENLRKKYQEWIQKALNEVPVDPRVVELF